MNQVLVDELRGGNYGTKLSDEDVFSIWESVSNFIERHLKQQKGVHIPKFGTFSFVQKKLDVGNNRQLLIQRPVFTLAEHICQTHSVQQTRAPVAGAVPVVPLNYAALAADSAFDRDRVETCVRGMLTAFGRALAAGSINTAELVFVGVGRLQVRDGRVKFKFYKELVSALDASGHAVESMQNRPGTVDSVMTDRSVSRACTVTLPKIPSKKEEALPIIDEDTALEYGGQRDVVEHADDIELTNDRGGKSAVNLDTARRPESRSLPIAGAVTFDDLLPTRAQVLATARSSGLVSSRSGAASATAYLEPPQTLLPLGPPATQPLLSYQPPSSRGSSSDSEQTRQRAARDQLERLPSQLPSLAAPEDLSAAGKNGIGSADGDDIMSGGGGVVVECTAATAAEPVVKPDEPTESQPEPMAMTQGGDGAQEETAASIPQLKPSLAPPRRPVSVCGHLRCGQELCYVCHQRARRTSAQAAVSFAGETRQRERDEDRAYDALHNLKVAEHKRKEHENILARRHDAQKSAAFNDGVAEYIKAQRRAKDTAFHKSWLFRDRPHTPPRAVAQTVLDGQLREQVVSRERTREQQRADKAFLERLERVQLAEDLVRQREEYLAACQEEKENYRKALSAQVRSRPVEAPPAVDQEPVFGKNDVTTDLIMERRRRAQEVMESHLTDVTQKKRSAILRRLQEQKYEEEVLRRCKDGLTQDNAERYRKRHTHRRALEHNWLSAAAEKAARERAQAEREEAGASEAQPLLEQCDAYHRCGQCRRRMENTGETNIWCDSYYSAGSRYIC